MFTTKSFLTTYKTVLALEASVTKLTEAKEIVTKNDSIIPGYLVIGTDLDDDRVLVKHLESVVNNAVANVMPSIGLAHVPNDFKAGITVENYPDRHIALHHTELQFVHNGTMYVLIVGYYTIPDNIQDVEIIVHLRPY
jgi:hypothetical protein